MSFVNVLKASFIGFNKDKNSLKISVSENWKIRKRERGEREGGGRMITGRVIGKMCQQPTGVDEDVFLEIRVLIETLGAEMTGEGADAGMDQPVGGQRRRAPKMFPAFVALLASFFFVFLVCFFLNILFDQ